MPKLTARKGTPGDQLHEVFFGADSVGHITTGDNLELLDLLEETTESLQRLNESKLRLKRHVSALKRIEGGLGLYEDFNEFWASIYSQPSGSGVWANKDSETCRNYFGWLRFVGGADNLDVAIPLAIGLMDRDSVLRIEDLSGMRSIDEIARRAESFTTTSLFRIVSAIEYFLDTDEDRDHPSKIILDSINEEMEWWVRKRYENDNSRERGWCAGVRYDRKDIPVTDEESHRRKILRKLKSSFANDGLIRRDPSDHQTWHIDDEDFLEYCRSLVEFSASQGGVEDPSVEKSQIKGPNNNSHSFSRNFTLKKKESGRYKSQNFNVTITPSERSSENARWAETEKWHNVCATVFDRLYSRWVDGGGWFLSSVKRPDSINEDSKPSMGWKLHSQILSVLEQETMRMNADPNYNSNLGYYVERGTILESLAEKGIQASHARMSQVMGDLAVLERKQAGRKRKSGQSQREPAPSMSILDFKFDDEDGRKRLYRLKKRYRNKVQDSEELFHLEKLMDSIGFAAE